jgi:hypothetical protein
MPAQVALQVVYDAFRADGEWPEYAYVDKALDRRGLVAEDALADVPAGLIIPEPGRHGAHLQRHDRIKLTVAGIARCSGSDDDLALFLRVLRFFVRLDEEYDPPRTGSEPLTADSDRLVAELDLSRGEVLRAYRLLEVEPHLVGGGGGNEERWGFEIPARIRRFRDVRSIDEYLVRRPKPPDPVQGVADVTAALAPFAAALEKNLLPEKRWMRLLVKASEHPFVSAVIGGVIATVVGGLLLAVLR